MSAAHEASLHPDEKYKAGKMGQKVVTGGLIGFVVLTALSWFLSGNAKDHLGTTEGSGHGRFFYGYLIGWTFILSIALGALLYIIIHHLVKAKWSTSTRRVAEILAGTLPLIGLAGLVIIIPLLAGRDDIYWWANHGFDHAEHVSASKHTWLSPAFFAVRYVIYFAIWIGLTRYFTVRSRKQDETGDLQLSKQMQFFSAPAVILYAMAICYAAFDFLMTLAPQWWSTIYGVNYFGGAMIAGYASIALLSMILQRTGRLQRSITTEHYHDLGKMVFAFTFFWAYTAFSQFMLIWYANVAEETVFYNYRMFNEGWKWVSIVLTFGQWLIPFVLLMSRWSKRILPLFAVFCVWQLCFHWLDLYWNVMPNYHWGSGEHEGVKAITGPLTGPVMDNNVDFNIADITTWFALIALFVAGVGRGLKGNLIPVKDPNLGASVAHENY